MKNKTVPLNIEQLNGWVILDKEKGITSAQAINFFKRKLKYIFKCNNLPKIGHGGTLDPLATGALAIAIGDATKTVSLVMDKSKTYIFSIKFGIKTSSYDLGTPIVEYNNYCPSKECLKQCLKYFMGPLKQQPPLYSAIKVNGKRAYKLAYQQEEISLAPRDITIYDIKLLNYNKFKKTATFMAQVGKGTYIRSLTFDISKSVKALGTVTYLRRIRLGSFQEKPLLLSKFLYNKETSLYNYFYSIEQVLDDIPGFECSKEEVKHILNGNTLFLNSSFFESFKNNIYKALYKDKVFSILKIINGVAIILRNFNNNFRMEEIDVDR